MLKLLLVKYTFIIIVAYRYYNIYTSFYYDKYNKKYLLKTYDMKYLFKQ